MVIGDQSRTRVGDLTFRIPSLIDAERHGA